MPPDVAEELISVVNGNPVYVFWTGNGEERTAVSHWQDDFRKLFRDANITSKGNMVSHRFRDTFAVDLAERCSARRSFKAARARVHQDYREALCKVGQG